MTRRLGSFPSAQIALPIGALGGAAPSALPFFVDRQLQDLWCWAAVSSSVAKYFDATTHWTQCAVAGAESANDCCTNGGIPQCDRSWYLDLALQRVGHLATAFFGDMDPEDVADDLGANLPVGIRVEWASGSGHFLVIRGMEASGPDTMYHLTDPIYGPGYYSERALQRGEYLDGRGRWTHSYRTHA